MVIGRVKRVWLWAHTDILTVAPALIVPGAGKKLRLETRGELRFSG